MNSRDCFLVVGGGKIGHSLNLFRKEATPVAADFVTKVLNGRLAKTALVGVDRQAEVIVDGREQC